MAPPFKRKLWCRLKPVDWSQRHSKRIPDDIHRASTETVRDLLRVWADGSGQDIGKSVQWMGRRSLDLELFPFKTHLVDLRAYRVRLMGQDRTRHQSCFSFPTEHQSHIFGPDGTMQFNNSGQRATSQKGSSTLSGARIRMPTFYANSLAVQRTLGCAPNAGIGLTQLQNTVPGGCFSIERLRKRDLRTILYDWKSISQLDMDRYPAARRLGRPDQRLQFLTGKFTIPGTVHFLDLLTRTYNVARVYEHWVNALAAMPKEERDAYNREADAEEAEGKQRSTAAHSNYKRADSIRRIIMYCEDWYRERRRKAAGTDEQLLAKLIIRHFKTALKALRIQQLEDEAAEAR